MIMIYLFIFVGIYIYIYMHDSVMWILSIMIGKSSPEEWRLFDWKCGNYALLDSKQFQCATR